VVNLIITGAFIGLAGVLLSYYGNPANTGFCVSCFMENIAGSIGLHGNIRMQFIRPEIIGFVLVALFGKKRLNEVAKGLGKSTKELQKVKNEYDKTTSGGLMNMIMQEEEKEEEAKKDKPKKIVKTKKGGDASNAG